MTLNKLDDGVWEASAPQAFMGWQFGARMAVVQLGDGSLWLHSPLALSDELAGEVAALGPVAHIVAPSLYHHLYAGEWKAAYPDATLHGAPGLAKKRTDLAFDAVLQGSPNPAWGDAIDSLPIAGTMLGETVFLHKPSRTLIGADLTLNIKHSDHWWTRTYLKASGVYGKVGLSKTLRLAFRDKRAARASIDQVLERDFQRIVIAHGLPILTNAKASLRDSYLWLKP